eukprot:Clim_evm35s230 gene=Clim_evmTU35s230
MIVCFEVAVSNLTTKQYVHGWSQPFSSEVYIGGYDSRYGSDASKERQPLTDVSKKGCNESAVKRRKREPPAPIRIFLRNLNTRNEKQYELERNIASIRYMQERRRLAIELRKPPTVISFVVTSAPSCSSSSSLEKLYKMICLIQKAPHVLPMNKLSDFGATTSQQAKDLKEGSQHSTGSMQNKAMRKSTIQVGNQVERDEFCEDTVKTFVRIDKGLQRFPLYCLVPLLEHLDLSENNIKDIPPAIGDLEHLRILKFRKCGLQDLPVQLHRLSLVNLDISDNQFKRWPKVLCAITSLRLLHVQKNKGISLIDPRISELKSLHTFNIAECSITFVPEELMTLKNLRNLKCYGNPLYLPRDDHKFQQVLLERNRRVNRSLTPMDWAARYTIEELLGQKPVAPSPSTLRQIAARRCLKMLQGVVDKELHAQFVNDLPVALKKYICTARRCELCLTQGFSADELLPVAAFTALPSTLSELENVVGLGRTLPTSAYRHPWCIHRRRRNKPQM